MPKSEETANAFMSGGRGDGIPAQMDTPLNVLYPANNTVPGYDLSGGIKMEPAGVEYDRVPHLKNPRSVSDQSKADGLKLDAQGK